jgi:hypothetical protein
MTTWSAWTNPVTMALGDHQNTGTAFTGANVSANLTVHPQAIGKYQVSFNATALGDQAFDGGCFFYQTYAASCGP